MQENAVLLMTTDTLGAGDEALGKKLMSSYLYTLTQCEDVPGTIILMNAGVNLAVEGSLVLEDLKHLAGNGVTIMACGTCLDYYGLKEKLGVGEVGNMQKSAELMNRGDKVITLG